MAIASTRAVKIVDIGELEIQEVDTGDFDGDIVGERFTNGSEIELAIVGNGVFSWDAKTPGLRLAHGEFDFESAKSAAFSPDGRWLAVMDSEGEIELFDRHERVSSQTLSMPNGSPNASTGQSTTFSAIPPSLEFSGDSQWLGKVDDQRGIVL